MSDPFVEKFNEYQSIILLARRVQLSISCVVLALIIIITIKKKLYVYNTTKLFMFCCVCYFIGMFIVLLHFTDLTAGFQFSYTKIQQGKPPYDPDYLIYNILTKMKENKSLFFFCGFEGFINLFFYNLGYYFAILVTYNVHCVITDNYRNFIKKRLKSVKTWVVLTLMLLTYLIPFILMYVSQFNGSYFYSYGPAGFKTQVTLPQQGDRESNLVLFCGIGSNPKPFASAVSIINAYIFSLIMLIYHFGLLCYNHGKISELIGRENYLNSKQLFIVKSGKISIVVFFIQFLNFFKLLLDTVFRNAYTLLLVMNFVFDLYPFVLLFFFFKYTQQKASIERSSNTLLQQSDD